MKYLEKFKSLFKKREEVQEYQDTQVQDTQVSQDTQEYQEEDQDQDQDQQVTQNFVKTQEPKKKNSNRIILGITVGFALGALASSVAMYFGLKSAKTGIKPIWLTRMPQPKSIPQPIPQPTSVPRPISMPQSVSMPQTTNMPQHTGMPQPTSLPRDTGMPQTACMQQNVPFTAQILSTIDNLSSYNTFASFYVSKLNKEKRQKQTVLKEQQPPPPPPPALPPLRALIGNSLPQIPPLPQMSMIICSNNSSATLSCYAISSDGQVYTNGFIQGDHKLVITPTQAYWKKIKRK